MGLARKKVAPGAGFVLYDKPGSDRLPKDLGPVWPGRSPDLTDEHVARRRDRRIPDAALAQERFGKATPSQVVEYRSGESVPIELRRAIKNIRGRRLLMLRPRQMMFPRKRPQGGRMIGVIEQSLGEIEHIAPAAAAPAPEPLGAVSLRAVDAQGRPMGAAYPNSCSYQF